MEEIVFSIKEAMHKDATVKVPSEITGMDAFCKFVQEFFGDGLGLCLIAESSRHKGLIRFFFDSWEKKFELFVKDELKTYCSACGQYVVFKCDECGLPESDEMPISVFSISQSKTTDKARYTAEFAKKRKAHNIEMLKATGHYERLYGNRKK